MSSSSDPDSPSANDHTSNRRSLRVSSSSRRFEYMPELESESETECLDIDVSEDSDMDPTFKEETIPKKRKKKQTTGLTRPVRKPISATKSPGSSNESKADKSHSAQKGPENEITEEKKAVAQQKNMVTEQKIVVNQTNNAKNQQKNKVVYLPNEHGQFFVHNDDLKKNYKDIKLWKMRGKALLEEMKPEIIKGEMYYINNGIYRGFSPSMIQSYKQINADLVNVDGKKVAKWHTDKDIFPDATIHVEDLEDHHRSNFDVVIQALLSEVLCPNFIFKACLEKKDKYFVQNIEKLDKFVKRKAEQLLNVMPWNNASLLVKSLNISPSLSVINPSDKYMACTACERTKVSCKVVVPSGSVIASLRLLEENPDPSLDDTKLWNVCENCLSFVKLYSKIVHYKHGCYQECKEKVNKLKKDHLEEDRTTIIVECRSDEEWISKLFEDLQHDWKRIDDAVKARKVYLALQN